MNNRFVEVRTLVYPTFGTSSVYRRSRFYREPLCTVVDSHYAVIQHMIHNRNTKMFSKIDNKEYVAIRADGSAEKLLFVEHEFDELEQES